MRKQKLEQYHDAEYRSRPVAVRPVKQVEYFKFDD